MTNWPKVSLDELLYRADDTAIIDSASEYNEVTIKL